MPNLLLSVTEFRNTSMSHQVTVDVRELQSVLNPLSSSLDGVPPDAQNPDLVKALAVIFSPRSDGSAHPNTSSKSPLEVAGPDAGAVAALSLSVRPPAGGGWAHLPSAILKRILRRHRAREREEALRENFTKDGGDHHPYEFPASRPRTHDIYYCTLVCRAWESAASADVKNDDLLRFLIVDVVLGLNTNSPFLTVLDLQSSLSAVAQGHVGQEGSSEYRLNLGPSRVFPISETQDRNFLVLSRRRDQPLDPGLAASNRLPSGVDLRNLAPKAREDLIALLVVCPTIEDLDLCACSPITDKTLTVLEHSLPSLYRLDILFQSALTAPAVASLSAAHGRHLVFLCLDWPEAADNIAIKALATHAVNLEHPNLPNLTAPFTIDTIKIAKELLLTCTHLRMFAPENLAKEEVDLPQVEVMRQAYLGLAFNPGLLPEMFGIGGRPRGRAAARSATIAFLDELGLAHRCVDPFQIRFHVDGLVTDAS
ncbi:hypothetical protein BDK51DRAFT_38317 [Blyttiomyces helicus]|uniref:F-box domain-containing protein n=1 Tax=Blyttiomyces helicus TaxID=388810 RepID=A0A4P9W6I3_9FUNG|nr:hypothetical protein BDK51DRAFT_38317 [Blyttiomyces helicus]|eukprot:RKO86975.1 hypothetical protein BDK51DRAFT_38317 [Blyttiomyces helicus]